jgi:tight adherence protein B
MVPLLMTLIFVVTFLAATVAVIVASAILDTRRAAPSGVSLEGFDQQLPMLLEQQPMSTISLWQEVLSRLDFFHLLKRRIAEAGLKWPVGRVAAAMLLLGSIALALGIGMSWMPLSVAMLLGVVAANIPCVVVLMKRTRRFEAIEDQVPDVLDALARALRAGHPFVAAMDLVARETPSPLGIELRRTCDEQRLGSTWPDALGNLADRVPLMELRLVAAAVTVQTRTGGRLTELFERLADTIRESVSLRGDVRAISAQGRLTGTILTILPVGLACIMYMTSPQYIMTLFRHPLGPMLIVGAAVCLVLGHLAIRRIVDVKG